VCGEPLSTFRRTLTRSSTHSSAEKDVPVPMRKLQKKLDAGVSLSSTSAHQRVLTPGRKSPTHWLLKNDPRQDAAHAF
jgi:hypothetical protein